MKTITKDLRSVIFQQYHSQYVNSSIGLCKLRDSDRVDEIEWIELKKLSNITDEDAIEAIQMNVTEKYEELKIESKNDDAVCYSFHTNRGGRLHGFLTYDDLRFNVYQYLQSKGYALPYMDYSVQDLVELGIYKLK